MKYIIVPILFLAACSTVPTGNESADRRNRVVNALLQSAEKTLGRVAVYTLKNVVTTHLDGGKIDLANAAAQGAWTSAENLVSGDDIAKIISAWSGDKLPAVSIAASQALDGAIAAGVNPTAASNAIAATISAGALSK
jgi:hypothetical protein